MWIVGLAIVLIIGYGLVSMIQRRSQSSGRMEVAESERNRIAAELNRLQSATGFLEVYQSGELAEVASEIREKMTTANEVFADTVAQLDTLRSSKVGNSLDRQVRLSRIIESFQKIGEQLPRIQRKLNDLNSQVETAKRDVAPLQHRFTEIRSRLAQSLGNECPPTWVTAWQQIDQRILSLSLQGESDTTQLHKIEDDVNVWSERAAALVAWREWKTEYTNRSDILGSCMERLRALVAEKTHVYRLLEQTVQDGQALVQSAPEAVIQEQMIHRCRALQRELPSRLSMAMRLLSTLTDRDKLEQSLAQCRDEAEAVVSSIVSDTFSKMDRAARDIGSQGQLENAITHKQACLEELNAVLVASQERPPTPAIAVVQIDALIYCSAELRKYEDEVKQAYAHAKQDESALHTRLIALNKRITEVMARMAEVNLLDSDEYRKLSAWQAEIHAHEENDDVTEVWMARLERRIADEIPIVDATVRNHKALDDSMNNHLNQMRRTGRFSGADGRFDPVDVQNRMDAGDILGAAFSSLVLTEMLDDVIDDSNWDSW